MEFNCLYILLQILKKIGEQTAISLEVSRPAAGGIIKSREFLTVRRVDKIGDIYISAGIFTDYNIDMPPSEKVRCVPNAVVTILYFYSKICNVDNNNQCAFSPLHSA